MQKVEGSSPFIRFRKAPEIRGFSFPYRPSRAQNRPRQPLSSTKPGIQTCVEGPPQPVEVANEVGFDEPEVAADLDAGDDAAPRVVAQRGLLERQELGGFGGGQQSRVGLTGDADALAVVAITLNRSAFADALTTRSERRRGQATARRWR